MARTKVSLVAHSIFLVAIAALLASVSAAQTERVIFHFNGTTTSGGPQDDLVADTLGNFYGTTFGGGSASLGVVYELRPPVPPSGAWTQTILYNFTGPDGSQPAAGLNIDAAGNLYGTTVYGGNGPCTILAVLVGCGVVFELSPPAVSGGSWTESVLYNFQYGGDSGAPRASLIFDHSGNLYGTASGFGPFDSSFNDSGAVFQLSPPSGGGAWTETTLLNFPVFTQGATPFSPLAIDASGNLYGTTFYGGVRGCTGNLGCGVVYQLVPPLSGGNWTENVIHSFSGGNADGANPVAGVAVGPSGILIGTTISAGSPASGGTVFALQPPTCCAGWTYGNLHAFGGSGDGAAPSAGVTFGAGRTFYGTTTKGGTLNEGIVFRFTPPATGGAWTETILHSFDYSSTNKADGASPSGGVVIHQGARSGVTGGGGPKNAGTVYRVVP